MRYFIELAYKGTNYNGWQRQPNAQSVQQTIEQGMSTLLRRPITITGCGRTDTGVHSSNYYAHFEYEGDKTLDSHFIYHLNAILPRDIAVYDVFQTHKHARFDAQSREYQYFIATRKDPFALGQVWFLKGELDVEKMQCAADKLLEYSDFSSFEKLHSDNKTSLCKITRAEWHSQENRLVFTIAADRFLRGMVRAIVSTLVDVGRGKITPEGFAAIIEAKNRSKASGAAPADGLFLTRIEY
ncbi:MAG: tRNA pseudouridine(38-40) synthase TruA [Rikenellaceae bacterium]